MSMMAIQTTAMSCLGGCGFLGHTSGFCTRCWEKLSTEEQQRHTAEQAKLEPARALKARQAREAKERLFDRLKELKKKEIELRRGQCHLRQAGECSVVSDARPMFEWFDDVIPGPIAELAHWSCGDVSSLAFMSPEDHEKHDKARLLESKRIVDDLDEMLGDVDAGSMFGSEGNDYFRFYQISVLDNSKLRNLTTPVDAIIAELTQKRIPKGVAEIVVPYARTLSVFAIANAVFGDESFDFHRISHNRTRNIFSRKPQYLDSSEEEEEEQEEESKSQKNISKRKENEYVGRDNQKESEEKRERKGDTDEQAGDEYMDEKTRDATLKVTKYMKGHMIRGSLFEACFPAGARDENTIHHRMFGGLTMGGDLICMSAEVVWT